MLARFPTPPSAAAQATASLSGPPLDPRADPLVRKFGVVRDVRRDAVVLESGAPTPVYLEVVSGTLRLVFTTRSGRRHVPAFLHPGDTTASRWLLDDSWSLEAVTPATTLQWSGKALADLVARHPETALPWLAATERALAGILLQGRAATLQSAAARLASFLLAMAERQGRRATADGPIALELGMRRTDIADHLAVSAETVSRELARLRQDGLIGLAGPRHLTIRRPAALARLAEDEEMAGGAAPP